MLKIVLIVVVVLLFAGMGVIFMVVKGPDVSKYTYLQDPQIVSIPDATVLEVSFRTSTEGLKEVFGFLFKNYFKIKGVPKLPWKIPPSLARYHNPLDFDMEASKRKAAFENIIWQGAAALPLPINITSAPNLEHKELTAGIVTWKYGNMAEILHIGAYEEEGPSVQKLNAFIEKQGYEIVGLHEEVYLRGPGTPFCKPENYYTIIRYPVNKKQK